MKLECAETQTFTVAQRDEIALTYVDDPKAQRIALDFAELVACIGIGFHADTRCRDYVNADGSRVFTDAEAAECDALVERAFGVLDPYQFALDVWAMLGLITWNEARA